MATQQDGLELPALIHRRRELPQPIVIEGPPRLAWIGLYGVNGNFERVPEAAVRDQGARLRLDCSGNGAQDRRRRPGTAAHA